MVQILYLAGAALVAWIAFTTDYGIWAVLAFAAAVFLGIFLDYLRTYWNGLRAERRPLVYLDARMGVRPTILKNTVPDGYRLTCLFFRSGLIDRTQTLDHGFQYTVLDPIPSPVRTVDDIGRLVERRARDIVSDAQRYNRPIHLLWSGGIDSTAAAVALIKHLTATGDLKRLTVYYTPASRREYKLFFHRFIKGKVARRKVSEVAPAFEKNSLVVTGEMGDQLFGSATALDLPFELLNAPWQTAFPQVLAIKLASRQRADIVVDYLAPQLAAAPVPLPSLYEALWWLNFSMKWQIVGLRMIAHAKAGSFSTLRPRVAHFFDTPDFQRWAMASPDKRIIGDRWTTYKWPLRDLIRDFTGDDDYHATKRKEPSLKGMLRRPVKRSAVAVLAAGDVYYQHRDESLKKPLNSETAGPGDNDSEFGVSFEFSETREAPLWDDLGDGE